MLIYVFWRSFIPLCFDLKNISMKYLSAVCFCSTISSVFVFLKEFECFCWIYILNENYISVHDCLKLCFECPEIEFYNNLKKFRKHYYVSYHDIIYWLIISWLDTDLHVTQFRLHKCSSDYSSVPMRWSEARLLQSDSLQAFSHSISSHQGWRYIFKFLFLFRKMLLKIK